MVTSSHRLFFSCWTIISLAAATLFFNGGLHAETVILKPSGEPIPVEYFGFHMHRAATTTPWPQVPFGTWRLWDAYAAWTNLEPEMGKWDFSLLDKYVALAETNNVKLLLPLGLSPPWASARPWEKSSYGPGRAAEPRNIADWRNYVLTVATRYKGRIHAYDLWNEVNEAGFYSGTVDQMVNLAREAYIVLKRVDPENILVSPSLVGKGGGFAWLDEFLAKGGGQYVDVIGYHFYVPSSPPEAMLPLIDNVRNVMMKHSVNRKPLWNTESGWVIANVGGEIDKARNAQNWPILSIDQASAYISRSLILGWAAGLKRYYWYAWDSSTMGLWEEKTKTPKPAVTGYLQTIKWLRGAVMDSCNSNESGIWVCGLTRSGGRRAWLVWNPERVASWRLPPSWKAVELETLGGDVKNLHVSAASGSVQIGPAPVLVKADFSAW